MGLALGMGALSCFRLWKVGLILLMDNCEAQVLPLISLTPHWTTYTVNTVLVPARFSTPWSLPQRHTAEAPTSLPMPPKVQLVLTQALPHRGRHPCQPVEGQGTQSVQAEKQPEGLLLGGASP